MSDPTTRLREIVEAATPGEWEVQDGSSWRRIGTRGRDASDGNVLQPFNSRSDNHPDLCAGRGEDVYANLTAIIVGHRLLCAITDPAFVEKAGAAVHAAECPDGAKNGFTYDVADAAHKAYCDKVGLAVLSRLAAHALGEEGGG